MACELWVIGSVYYQGQTYSDYTRAIRSSWNAATPLPPISLNTSNVFNQGYNHYNDGLGGIFDGTGWMETPSYYLKGCNEQLTPNQKYDCINGSCLPATTYRTPGKYASLTACSSGCAKDSKCTGECVSPEELAALQQAANNLKSRLCK